MTCMSVSFHRKVVLNVCDGRLLFVKRELFGPISVEATPDLRFPQDIAGPATAYYIVLPNEGSFVLGGSGKPAKRLAWLTGPCGNSSYR